MSLTTAVAIDAPTHRNRSVPAGDVYPEEFPTRASAIDLFDVPSSILIVGHDERNRPHASRFPVADAIAVGEAATMMGMETLAVQSPALAELAAMLPAGKLFASGKAFVPFVGQELYRRLEAYLPIAARGTPALSTAGVAKGLRAGGKSAANDPDGDGKGSKDAAGSATSEQNKYADAKATKTPRSGKYPEDWDKVAAGHIVLASDERDDGWWTAYVREVRADSTYLLEWEEWQGFDKFVRRREQIALLHPDYDGR